MAVDSELHRFLIFVLFLTSIVWTLDFDFVDVVFGCTDVGFWSGGCWNLVVRTLDFGCVDVGFWVYERWMYHVQTLYFVAHVATNIKPKSNVGMK